MARTKQTARKRILTKEPRKLVVKTMLTSRRIMSAKEVDFLGMAEENFI